MGLTGGAGWDVVGCTLAVVFTLAVAEEDAVVAMVAEVCPGFELAAPLCPLPALLPFLTVLRGVTSLPLGGGVSRVVEVVTTVPLMRVPTRL